MNHLQALKRLSVSQGFERRKLMTTAWHYTTGERFLSIVECGFLLPATALITSKERPVVWFSLNQEWEPTANKMLRSPDGTLIFLDKEGTCKFGGGLVRFGYPLERTIRWPLLARKAKIPPTTRVGLELAARENGSNPNDWCGVLRPVPLDELTIEVLDGEKWVSVRSRTDDLAVQAKGERACEVTIGPAASLG